MYISEYLKYDAHLCYCSGVFWFAALHIDASGKQEKVWS